MPVNFSIKNVPDDLASRLRNRADRNHRSLQGELMAILELAVTKPEPLTFERVLQVVRDLNLASGPESVEMIRDDREGR